MAADALRRATTARALTSSSPDLISRSLVQQADKWAADGNFPRFDRFYGKTYFYPIGDNAQNLRDSKGRFVGFNQYCFDMQHQKIQPLSVRLTILNMIQILYLGAWTTIASLLDDLSRTQPLEGEMSWGNSWWPNQSLDPYERQWLWWKKNGKKFRFFDLPLEIREIIYGFSVNDTVLPYLRKRRRTYNYNWAQIEAFTNRQLNLNFRRTCRQVRAEFHAVIFRHASFRITHAPILTTMITGQFSLMERITKLKLELGHEAYLKLFGIVFDPSHAFVPNAAAQALRKASKLRELVLCMPPPCDIQTLFPQPQIEGLVICHRMLIEYILEAALSWVKGHANVRAIGYLQPSQKVCFERVCKEQHLRYLTWCKIPRYLGEGFSIAEWDQWEARDEGGVRIVEEGGDHEHTREYPPICECMRPCHSYWWENLV